MAWYTPRLAAFPVLTPVTRHSVRLIELFPDSRGRVNARHRGRNNIAIYMCCVISLYAPSD
jgi:hypothetical protein